MFLQLDGVTESSGWYKVTYEGDDGWVAGAYLLLSMGGRQYARAFIGRSSAALHRQWILSWQMPKYCGEFSNCRP